MDLYLSIFIHHKEDDYYKPVRVGAFWSTNYIVYKSNGDRYKTLSVENYLDKTRPPYSKYIINNIKKSDTCKSQLTIAISSISSINSDEEREMHSKSDNIKIMINDKADEVIEKLFQPFVSRY